MLEQFKLLSDLTPQQRQQVEDACEKVFYPQGKILFKEGEESTDIFFLVSGKVALSKIEASTQNDLVFKEMFPGESFGEMSFVDGSPRSCSIVAAEDTEVYVLSKPKLLENAPEANEIVRILTTTTTRQVNNYLRYLSDRHVEALQAQINELRERTNFGYFFVFLTILLFMTALVNACLNVLFPGAWLKEQWFSWLYLLVGFGVPLVIAAFKTKLPPRDVGFTTKNLRKSAIDGVIFTSIGIVLVVAFAFIAEAIAPETNFKENLLNFSVSITSLLYFFHSYIQEALRAMIQVVIQRFLVDSRAFTSIAITSLIFAICHMHFGIAAILVTLFSCPIFGFIFIRSYNLLGVSIFHFVMGVVVFKVLMGIQ